MTGTPVFLQTPKLRMAKLTPSSTVGVTTNIWTGGTNGSKITGMWFTSTDTVGATVQAVTFRSTSHFLVDVDISAGTDGVTPAVNVFSLWSGGLILPGEAAFPGIQLDEFGCPFVYVAASQLLGVNCVETVNTGEITLFVMGADY